MDGLREVLVQVPNMSGTEQIKSRIAAVALSLFALMARKVGAHQQVHDDYILRFVEYAMDSWQRNQNKQPPIDISRLSYLAKYLTSDSKLLALSAMQAVFQLSQNSPVALADEGVYFTQILEPLATLARQIREPNDKYFAELAAEIGGNARLRDIAQIPANAANSELIGYLRKFVAASQQSATYSICT
jgi:hypothetical protein